jgi:hypothetical protein
MAWHKRGRPRKANAKRRATTIAGRRGETDTGTEELRRRKRRIAAGREDLELTGAAVLFAHEHLDRQQFDTLGVVTVLLQLAHEHLDRQQFDTLGVVTVLLQQAARGWGGRDGSVSGLWEAITGALIRTAFAPAPVGDGGFSSLADSARRRLARLIRALDGSRDLVIELAEGRVPPLVLHVLERGLDHADEGTLDRLRTGLDSIAGRRQG